MSFLQGEVDAIDCVCRFIAQSHIQLNRIELLPAGVELNMVEVFNFRNRHYTAAPSPELQIGGKGFQTDTFSGDWQFAPHPKAAILIRASDYELFCGSLDLSESFGMYFSAADYHLNHWYLNYGEFPNGLKVADGTSFQSPRFRFFAP